MFQAIRALTLQNILKIKIVSQKFFQNESFLLFSPKLLNLDRAPRKDTTIYTAWRHSYNSKKFISKKIVSSKFKAITRFRKLSLMEFAIYIYTD